MVKLSELGLGEKTYVLLCHQLQNALWFCHVASPSAGTRVWFIRRTNVPKYMYRSSGTIRYRILVYWLLIIDDIIQVRLSSVYKI